MNEEVPISFELKQRLEEHCKASGQSLETVLYEALSGFVSEKTKEIESSGKKLCDRDVFHF